MWRKKALDRGQGGAGAWRYSKRMWPYHPELLARPVPRYTSYPTAVEFTDAVGEADLGRALDGIAPDQSLSLYAHIPFCEEVCWYCGCNTGRSNRAKRLTAYLDALHSEIRIVSQRLAGRGQVRHIAFGGGSPNAIPPVDFARLVDELLIAFRSDAPTLSIEIDPRSFGPAWDIVLEGTHARRVSLGVQTFDAQVQAAVGRVQPHALIAEAVKRLRGIGVSSINFDLMYGLPGQTRDSLADTLDRAIALSPDRIALFGYAHVPHLVPRQRRIQADNLPDQAERFAMAASGYERLCAAGYVPVGFDHFALPGDPLGAAAAAGTVRRNFQGFTDDQSGLLIGFGASAISQFPDAIIQNDKNSGRYRTLCATPRLPAARGVLLDADDRIRSTVIEALLCAGKADLGRLGYPIESDTAFRPYFDAGLARFDKGVLSITDAGLPYARTIAARFDRYRADQSHQFSSAI